MKKSLSLLLVLLILLTGCSQNKADDNQAIESDETTIVEEQYASVILAINPSIRLYYDDSYNVIKYEYINQDAQDAWSDSEITGKNLTSVLEELITIAADKEYLNEDNNDIQITLMQEDETLQESISNMSTEYIEQSEMLVKVNLEQVDENNNTVVLETFEKDLDTLNTENISGIWVSEDWVNPSASSSINTSFTQTLVLMEDGTGVMASYVSENGANFEEYPRTFYDGLTWSENGTLYSTWIIQESVLGKCSYKNDDENLFIVYYPSSDKYYYQCKYLFEIKDGKLYRYNSDEEYVVYNKVSYFEEPYVGTWFNSGSLQTMNSMDYSNPKEVYNELRRIQDIYWDGSAYRNGLGTTYTKNGNIYSYNGH